MLLGFLISWFYGVHNDEVRVGEVMTNTHGYMYTIAHLLD